MGSDSVRGMERTISLVLRVGVIVSFVLVIIGLVLVSITGDTSYPFGVPEFWWFIWGDPFLAPSHILFIGFMVLISTPVLRVIVSILMYLKTRDAMFSAITAAVLMILIMSFMLGIG